MTKQRFTPNNYHQERHQSLMENRPPVYEDFTPGSDDNTECIACSCPSPEEMIPGCDCPLPYRACPDLPTIFCRSGHAHPVKYSLIGFDEIFSDFAIFECPSCLTKVKVVLGSGFGKYDPDAQHLGIHEV